MDGFQSRLDKAKQRISNSEDRSEINYIYIYIHVHTYVHTYIYVHIYVYVYLCIHIYIWNEAWRDKRTENKDERIKDIEKNRKMNINVSQNHRERCGTGAIFEEIMAENFPKQIKPQCKILSQITRANGII